VSFEAIQNVLKGTAIAWSAAAMSGTNKRTSTPLFLGDAVYSVSWMPDWTNGANVAGDFDVEESNDGVTWVAAGITSPTVNNNAGPAMVTFETSAAWVRLVYTNASGTGTLGTVTVQGKQRMVSDALLAQINQATTDVANAQAAADAAQDTADDALTPATTHDLSGIAAGTATFKVTPTSDTPATTWTNGVPDADPSGFIKILDASGNPHFLPYFD
jgi:hypothetical protein